MADTGYSMWHVACAALTLVVWQYITNLSHSCIKVRDDHAKNEVSFCGRCAVPEKEFFIDNLLVRIHYHRDD